MEALRSQDINQDTSCPKTDIDQDTSCPKMLKTLN